MITVLLVLAGIILAFVLFGAGAIWNARDSRKSSSQVVPAPYENVSGPRATRKSISAIRQLRSSTGPPRDISPAGKLIQTHQYSQSLISVLSDDGILCFFALRQYVANGSIHGGERPTLGTFDLPHPTSTGLVAN